MFKIISSVTLLCTLSACSTLNNHNQPKDLMFVNKDLNTVAVSVKRDNKLCKNEESNQQDCPIKLFIDDFKAGEFYINNSTTYYLKPNVYDFKVKNCNTKCDAYHISTNTKIINSHNNGYILTLDEKDKPIIIIDKKN